MPRYIINSHEWGVFVGEALGLGFWSKLDGLGQAEAPTFSSPEEAHALVLRMEYEPPQTDYLKVDTNETYATEAQCVAAGAQPWTQE